MSGRIVLVLSIVFFTSIVGGCNSEKQTGNRDDSPATAASVKTTPKQKNSNQDKQTQAQPAKRASRRRRRSIDRTRVKIDDLLAREDLTPIIRKKLVRHQFGGDQTVVQAYFEQLQDFYDLRIAIDNRLKSGTPATKSESEPVTASDYSSNPTSSGELGDQWRRFLALGIEHFEQLEFENVSNSDKKAIDDLIRKLFEAPKEPRNRDWWAKLDGEIVKLTNDNPARLRNDPFLAYCYGIVRYRQGLYRDSYGRFRSAIRNFHDTSYPARTVVHASLWALRSQVDSQYTEPRVEPAAHGFVAIKHWLEKDFRAEPEFHRCAAGFITEYIGHLKSNDQWETYDRLMEMFNRQTHLSDWLKNYINGEYHSDVAWKHRGNGFANTVSDEAWPIFDKNQEVANDYFLKAYEANPMFPEAATALISLSNTGHNDQEVSYWFEKAVQAQPDYGSAHGNVLISLLPQWGGSVEEMFEFADSAANPDDGRQPVPYTLVRCYYISLKYVRGDDAIDFFYKKSNVKKAVRAIDRMLEDGKSAFDGRSGRRTMLLTQKAILACRAEMLDVAREAFDALDGAIDPVVIRELKYAGIDVARGRTYALTDPVIAEQCRELIELEKAGEVSGQINTNSREILERSSELLGKTDHPEAITWLKRVRDIRQFETDYELGLEATLPFDKLLSLWIFNDKSAFEYESEDSVLIDYTESMSNLRAISYIGTRGPKIVGFDIEFLDKPGDARSRAFTPSATVMNYRNAKYTFGLNRLYRRSPQKPKHVYDLGQLSFGYRDNVDPLFYYYVPVRQFKNRIRIHMMPGYFELYLNNRFVCRSKTDNIMGPIPSFEICQPNGRVAFGKARFSGIRIGKWQGEVPPVKGSAEELVDHYRNESERAVDDRWTAYWFAQALHFDSQFTEAIEQYQRAVELGIEVEDVAFFIGDCKDQMGDTEEAIRWYKKAAAASSENVTSIFERTHDRNYSNSCHWAAFRLALLKLTHAKESVRNDLADFDSCDPKLPTEFSWAIDLLKAIEASQTGNGGDSTDSARAIAVLRDCPRNMRSMMEDAINQMFSDGFHYVDENNDPLYLLLEDSIPFFRCFEDHLDPAWNGVY